MAGSKKDYEMAIKIAGEIEKSFYSSTRLTKKELESIAKAAAVTSASVDKSLNDGFSNVNKGVTKFENAAKKAFKVTGEAALIAAAAVAVVSAASIYVGVSYEKQMSTVQALTGATGDEFESLKDKAKELGKNTQYSALEAGQAMEYMAQAGWKTSDMINGMDGVLNLAAASGEDFATVASIVTDSLTAFGLKASDTAHFSDVLAIAANATNTDVAMMGDTFSYVAPLAGALGYSIEDTAIAVGLMANSGIKASQAGTALRRIFAETTSGATLSAKAFGEMTIQTANADGSMRDLGDVMNDLRGAFSQMSESEKVANAESIAGKEAMSGLLAIVNAGENDYNNLTDAIYNCEGAAQAMAEIRIDNLAGDIDLLSSEMEGLGIEIYEQMNTPLRDVTQAAAEFVGTLNDKISSSNAIGNLMTMAKNYLPTAVRNIKKAGTALYEFSEPVINLGKFFLKNPDIIVSTITGIGSALVAFKVANGVNDLRVALSGLMAIMNPVTAGILITTGIIAGLGFAISEYNIQQNELMKDNLSKHFGDIALSMDDLQTAAKNIIGAGYFSQISDLMSGISKSEGFVSAMKEATNEVNKTHWKLAVGLELSSDDMTEYQSNIEEYIQNAQDFITNQGYTVSIATTLLLGEEGNTLNDSNGSFYSMLVSQVTELSTQINEQLSNAMDSGLTIDTEAKIAELLGQINEITSAVSQAEADAKFQMIEIQFSGKDLDAESFQNLQSTLNEYVTQATDGASSALQESLKSINAQLDLGYITQEQYDASKSQYMQGYYQTQADAILKSYDFMKNTIMDTYGAEIEPALDSINQAINEKLASTMSNDSWWANYSTPEDWSNALNNIYLEAISASGLSKDTQSAIGTLMQGMLPTTEQLATLSQQISDAGGQVPEAYAQALTDAQNLSAVGGSADAMWTMIGDAVSSSEEYSLVIEAAKQSGGNIPQQVGDAITAKQPEVQQKAKNLLDAIRSTLSQGIDVTVPVGVTYSTASSFLKNGKIPGYAGGGLITEPTLATFAEKVPEYAIPMDGSQNSISLWQQAGQMLGIYPKNGNENTNDLSEINIPSSPSELSGNTNSVQITYSPNLLFNGGTPSKQDIVDAGRMSQDEFNSMMQQYMKDNGRLCFQ